MNNDIILKETTKYLSKYRHKYNIEGNYIIIDKIKLRFHNMVSLPDCFGNIITNIIGLHNNNIVSLPKSFSTIRCNVIHLSNNKLTSLKNLGYVKKVVCYDNPIKFSLKDTKYTFVANGFKYTPDFNTKHSNKELEIVNKFYKF